MRWLADRVRQRAQRQRAERYVQSLPGAPDGADLAWLTTLCGDENLARRELRWLRWAVSRIVAEQDALDDRTAAEVVRVLHGVVARESASLRSDAVTWPARWGQYADAVSQRGAPSRLTDRLAAVLLQSIGHPVSDARRGPAGSGAGASSAEVVPALVRARAVVERYRTEANGALREAFGAVSLPEHVRPSTLRPSGT